MNASDRLNTCKSRGSERVAILLSATGARVRNAYAIYLSVGDSPKKFGLIPHMLLVLHGTERKDLLLTDEHAFH